MTIIHVDISVQLARFVVWEPLELRSESKVFATSPLFGGVRRQYPELRAGSGQSTLQGVILELNEDHNALYNLKM
jgi:hypothetical protein